MSRTISKLPLRIRVLGLMVGLGALAVGSLAIAEGFDPSVPTTVVVGRPQGHAVGERVDRGRRGRSRTELPVKPVELWRRDLAGGLELPPVIDKKGDVIAALVSPDVVRIGADGRQKWRTRLGSTPAVLPPVLTSDGSTAVVCGDGTLWSVSAGGVVRFTTDLLFRTSKALAAPVARDNGTVVVAGDLGLAVVAADGAILAKSALPTRPVGALISWRGGVLASTIDGAVYRWRPPLQPEKLGELGGALEGGVMLASRRTVVGVVDRHSVVVLDLLSGNTTLVLGGETSLLDLEGPTSLAPNEQLLVTSLYGELLGIDAHGEMQRDLALEPLPEPPDADAGAPTPSVFHRVETQASPPLIVDPKGRIAFVRNSGKLGIVDEEDNIFEVTPRLCARPIAILPAGEKRFVAACRSGSIVLYGEASEAPAEPQPSP